MLGDNEQIIIRKVDFEQFLEQIKFLTNEVKSLKKAVESDKIKAPTEWGNSWHSIKFVAEKLGVERGTLTYWAKCGKIEKRKVGEKIFISIKEVHDLLNLAQEALKVVPKLHLSKLKAS